MKNKKKIYGNTIIIALTFFILLITLCANRVDKAWADTPIEQIQMTLKEGNYNLDVTYKAKTDTYLEAYITSRNQEYVIAGFSLPATNGNAGTFSTVLPMKYSVLNDSLKFRCPYTEPDKIQFDTFHIKTLGIPVAEIICIIAYLLGVVFTYFMISDFGACVYAQVFWAANALLLHQVFNRNLVFLVIYVGVYLFSIYYFIIKEKIRFAENIKIFSAFYLLALFIMQIFTTSSPLFPFNLGCDENIYYAIGQGMAEGLQLYTQMFDHKGPFFFFIYMIGYLITPGKYYGIYLIEAVLMATSLFCIYKISSLYLKKKIACVAALSALPFLLDTKYIVKGGSFEQMAVPVMLGMLCLVLPLFLSDGVERNKGHKLYSNFFLQGLFSAIILFSKFSITFAWLALTFFSLLQLLWSKKIKEFWLSVMAYVAGLLALSFFVIVHFVSKGNLQSFVEYYFLFNAKYASVGNITDTVLRIISTVYEQFMINKVNSIMILTGMVGFLFSRRFLNWFGKFAFAGTFVILVGTTYAGSQSYDYYYTIIASFGVFGNLFLLYLLRDKLELLTSDNRIVLASGLLFVGLSMYCNDLILLSTLFDKEPTPQDILAQQMELRSVTGDVSFFEYDMLERGFYSQEEKAPFVQYFFYPNINDAVYSGVREAQLSYIADKKTEYVIFQRFRNDDYPELPLLNENYQYVTGYSYESGETFMLYQRK